MRFIVRRRRLAPWAAGFAVLALAGCAGAIGATPTVQPEMATPRAAPAIAQQASYPVRYFAAEAPVSLEVFPDWAVEETQRDPIIATLEMPESEGQVSLMWVRSEQARRPGTAAREALRAAGLEAVRADEMTAFQFSEGGEGSRGKGTIGVTRYDLVVRSGEGGSIVLLMTVGGVPTAAEQEAFDLMAASLRQEPQEPIRVPRERSLVLASGEPPTLDPARTHFGASGIIGDLYRGLVLLGPDMRIEPAIAERWEVSQDGTVYTFYLRDNARFHNGRPLTAWDVLFSWERAASPDTGSETVLLYMGDILGLAAYRAGEAQRIEGVQVMDDRTLQVTLDAPKPYFLAKLTYPVSWIVDRYNVALPNWELHPNGSGPFRQVQHLEGQVLILEANPYHYEDPPQLEYVVYSMYQGYAQQLYELGEVDMTGITRDQLERAQDPADGLYGEVATEVRFCTFYVTFNTRLAPFDDPLVRRAFVLAIDRAGYVEAVTNGEDVVAEGLLPPGMPGYDPAARGPEYDPEAARALLERSSYKGKLPQIVWTVPSTSGRVSGSVAFLSDAWERELGVEILLEGIDVRSYFDRLDAGEYSHLLMEGWCADYPDPENFFDVLFHSASPQNHSGYSYAGYDALVEAARVEASRERRLALYREAQAMLWQEAPALFLSHPGVGYMVLKPYVRGYVPSPIGVPQHQNMWLAR